MAKVRKKYNPLKGKLVMVNHALKSIGVFRSTQTQEDGECEVIDYKKGKRVHMGKSMAKAIVGLRHKWTIHIAAIGNNGFDDYIKSEVIECKHEMYQADLAEYLDKEHKKFIEKEMNPDHLRNVAWLAIPCGGEISESDFGELMSKMGAW